MGDESREGSTDADKVYVQFGGAGMHTLTPTVDQQEMAGQRDRDGDPANAKRVG